MLRSSLLENPESPLRSNPWSSSSTFVDVGSLQRVISLAERTGHLERRSDETEEITRRASLTSTSIQMITILKDITKLGHALNKVNRELQNLIRNAETQDVTDIDTLGQRAHKLEKMASHLSSIVEKKDDLIARLQQPFIGEYLEMDSAYHYSVSSSLPRIATCLATLPEHLENLEWAKRFSLTDGQLENVLVGIEASFADLQNHFRAVIKGRKAMEKLQNITIKENSLPNKENN
ncbi:AUGMIN subunit 2-like [Actinia tenebrosa]|uniref:AUGMIN subunit 2-like n=1 Tax=Actinia tenebrosa TaxID=6105 RepID=A0A6P8IXG1_ACTTE|nr:AUGMIN subunit 2-like [Actinia tenebrosa]